MLDNLTSDQSDDLAAWKNFAFSNGKIQKKDSKSKVEYDYLGSKKNNELLKIHDISGDQVTISF